MKRILILLTPIVLLVLAFRPVGPITISGTITDVNGQPIAFATVKEKGGRNAAAADVSGKFRITVSKSPVTLAFSAVGFLPAEITVTDRRELHVTLKTSEAYLKTVEVAKARGRADKRMQRLPAVAAGTTSYYFNTGDGDGEDDGYDREGYDAINENIFLKTNDNPLSTFSIDVDAASYSNVRRFINQGQLPPSGAVRIEEMINYFHYDYPQPSGKDPFSITTEISEAPWNKEHKLVLIGLQGEKISTDNLPASNLVFLIDVSGSMSSPNKLPLVKSSLRLLVDQLRAQDKVSIVVYAGAAGLVLPPTSGRDKRTINDAIDRLESGGSTAGGAGIQLAYQTARENFSKDGNNRVILCTDGDFNVGESSDDAMERMIEKERSSGVFLTVLGYGMGNYQDAKMQKLADKGNGNHAYIDGISEAKKLLVNEFGGTLFTIAKDVKLQVEFNPAKVQGYRLIGYENRMLAKEDFNDDKKDAGDLGSGHTVTALYEIIPVGVKSAFLRDVDTLKYQKNLVPLSVTSHNDELLTVKFRYKKPDGNVSQLMERAVKDKGQLLSATSDNFRFAAAVAEFGMLLRNSTFRANASFADVTKLAVGAKGSDTEGYRQEFLQMVSRVQSIVSNTPKRLKEMPEPESGTK